MSLGPQTIVCPDQSVSIGVTVTLAPHSTDGNGNTIDVSAVDPALVAAHQPTYTFGGGNPAIATIGATGVVTIVGPGTTSFTVDSAATDSYQAAAQHTVNFTVNASSDKAITAFTIPGGTTTISGTNITVTMPAGTDLTNLTPTITHTGAGVSPDSGVTVDFSGGSVTYTVTAADGTTQVYTVTVKIKSSGGTGGSSDDWEPLEDIRSYEQAIVIKCREWANVRSGPSTDTEIVGRVYLGESISLLEWNKGETWCKILYDGDSKLGWLYYKFIKPVAK